MEKKYHKIIGVIREKSTNVIKSIIYIIRNLIYMLPHKTAHQLLYLINHFRLPNLDEPRLYDEYIHWCILNVYDESYGKYADKYLVRDYVAQCGLGELLIPLLGVYEKPEDIDYDKLPNEFILKTTHGSGGPFYVICEDKRTLDQKSVNRKLKKALRIKMERLGCEYHYGGIRPRIICEELLHDKENDRMTDYKVVCVNGAPTRILVCTNRDKGRDYYDLDWNYLEHVKVSYRSGRLLKKPEKLAEMLEAARILSKPFPLARIDFYIVNDRLYFGEITLTPSGGNHHNLNEAGQRFWR